MADETTPAGDRALGDGSMDRQLGVLDCVLLSVGGMVGSAIFVFPGTTGQLAGPGAILAWVLAGLLMLTIALCYTELSLAFPRAGGPAVFPAETFGPWPTVRAFASYLEGICYAVGWAFGITVSALAIAEYAGIIVPAAGGHTVVLALVGIGLAVAVNLVGVSTTSRANILLSALLLAVLLLFVALGLANAEPANYTPVFPAGLDSIAAAAAVAMTGFGAWTVIPASAGEVRDPARTIPRAIVASLAISTVLYGAIVAAVHGVIPAGEFVEGSAVAAAPLGVAAESMGVPIFETLLLPLAAIVAIFTTMLVGVMSAGRVLYALGENGTLPAVVGQVSERTQVPWVGILLIGGLSAALAAFPRFFFQLLVVATVVGTGLPYAINILSLVGLRRYRPDVDSSFRVPAWPVLPIVAFGALAVAMIGLGATEVWWSVGALAVIAGGFGLRYLTAPRAIRPAVD
jgi:APA family basic amino acid/polyamine antiporter